MINGTSNPMTDGTNPKGKYPCGWCGARFKSARDCMKHSQNCPALHARIHALPSDLAHKVHRGGLKLEAAEREAAARPRIRL